MCNNKQVMSDKWNSKWRPPPSWIYYFGQTVHFRGSHLHYCKISFIYVNRRLSYYCLYKNPRWRLPPSNYNFVMLDHPRSSFMHPKFPFKFRVDRVRTFRDIAIRKFRKFGLKCLFRPPKKSWLWGVLTSKHCFLSSRPLKCPTLRGSTRFEP